MRKKIDFAKNFPPESGFCGYLLHERHRSGRE
jgi:hypothetical protein